MAHEKAESELIAAAVAGDRLALSKLLYLHHRPLARQLAKQIERTVRHLVSPEDLVQETYLCAFRDIHSCAARDEQTFGHWLSAIGSHQLQNAVKAARAQKRGGGRKPVKLRRSTRASSLNNLVELISAQGESPSQALARNEVAAAMQVGLASLPSEQRQVMQLRYLDGQT